MDRVLLESRAGRSPTRTSWPVRPAVNGRFCCAGPRLALRVPIPLLPGRLVLRARSRRGGCVRCVCLSCWKVSRQQSSCSDLAVQLRPRRSQSHAPIFHGGFADGRSASPAAGEGRGRRSLCCRRFGSSGQHSIWDQTPAKLLKTNVLHLRPATARSGPTNKARGRSLPRVSKESLSASGAKPAIEPPGVPNSKRKLAAVPPGPETSDQGFHQSSRKEPLLW